MTTVIIGVDPHKLSATIEVVDRHEKLLGSARFRTDQAGKTLPLRGGAPHPMRIDPRHAQEPGDDPGDPEVVIICRGPLVRTSTARSRTAGRCRSHASRHWPTSTGSGRTCSRPLLVMLSPTRLKDSSLSTCRGGSRKAYRRARVDRIAAAGRAVRGASGDGTYASLTSPHLAGGPLPAGHCGREGPLS